MEASLILYQRFLLLEKGVSNTGRAGVELKRRKYIRHPLNYPLTTRIISQEKHTGEVSGESHNIGAGGLLFISDKGMPEGSEVEIELKVEKRSFKLDGNVIRCEKIDGSRFNIAVSFNSPNELLKARMMEQVVRIEAFKDRLEKRYNVHLEFAAIAKEWIKRYSAFFANHYDI